ncbi:unnamed protein product [Arabis nemorensis]|uniref:Uncharacterized protein n=1 Tax=Arabis nemorensis TaxID=586526 RepID=A0A565ATW6_9BRAS|nr:unnamed protein product [Arabis nemorensis]
MLLSSIDFATREGPRSEPVGEGDSMDCEDDELDGEFSDEEPKGEEEAYSPGAEEELLSSGEACGLLGGGGAMAIGEREKSKRLRRRNQREFYRILRFQR